MDCIFQLLWTLFLLGTPFSICVQKSLEPWRSKESYFSNNIFGFTALVHQRYSPYIFENKIRGGGELKQKVGDF